jgi:hypothetical protein
MKSPFSYTDLETRVRANYRLRALREIVNTALLASVGDFAAPYSRIGRPK